MLVQRAITALLLLPIGIGAIVVGGPVFFVIAAIVILLASAEFLQLFLKDQNRLVYAFTLFSVLAILLARWNRAFELDPILLPLIIIGAMFLHLIKFENGNDRAASEFAFSLSAIIYVGLLGAFAISIRALEMGQWWLLIIFGATWIADMGAYFVGRSIGNHKMLPALSPLKSWEGYLGGIALSILLIPSYVGALAYLGMPEAPIFNTTNILVIALILSVVAPLGDFGISMIKRQFKAKHTSNLLREHGGMLDRLDSILWAMPIGYLLIGLLT